MSFTKHETVFYPGMLYKCKGKLACSAWRISDSIVLHYFDFVFNLKSVERVDTTLLNFYKVKCDPIKHNEAEVVSYMLLVPDYFYFNIISQQSFKTIDNCEP